MKTGLLITAYNRPEYLEKGLESVAKVPFNGDLEILIIDDHSTDKRTGQLIDLFIQMWPEVKKIRMIRNQGIKECLRTGFNFLFASGCQNVINLDGDAIVKPEFLEVLTNLKARFPDAIVSGFNTQTTDPKTGKVRHRTIGEFDVYCLKESIGGINMVINEAQYKTFLLPAFKGQNHWDWNLCKIVKSFVVSKPSVVQHIGIEKGSNLNNPDVAFDF